MDVINKFYSTVHTTVSQLSGVLPGNNVTREYEVLDQVCSAGVGLMWKVYNGFKKTTKQEVSVFVLEKKSLDRWSKDDRELILETLRRGVQQLTKIRHPHVLTVQHPLEESRDSLAFATEPVFSSLANLVGDQVRPEKKLYDVEIRHGLLQLFDGLQFLHNDAKIVHRNLTPETIMINKNRCWKLFGFDFCVTNQPLSDGTPFWPCKEYIGGQHPFVQPSLEYCAPEVILSNTNNTDSDLFALGVLIYTIYTGRPMKIYNTDVSSFRRFATGELNQRKYPPMTAIPEELRETVRALLHPSSNLRTKLHDIKEITYFHDVGVRTLNYLDSLYQWDNLQKSKFYKGLPQIIPTLPHRVNLHSVLPYLMKEFINSPMIPFVLPNVLLIAEMSTQKEYCDYILNHLKPIFKLTEPIQILLIFMQKMDLLLKLTPADEVKLHVLPLLYRSLECDMTQLQELCLNVLPTFSTLIDYNAMKNAVIPRIKKLCLSSTNVGIKVNCLISIGKLLENLDKWLVLDEILPFLQQINSREPAIIMAIIGIYKIAMTNTKLGITKDVMAHKCIPFLVPLTVENGLTLAQFNTIMTLIKEMLCRVEKEQKEKLDQLATIQRDNKPKNAADILASELENNGNSVAAAHNNSKGNGNDLFSDYMTPKKPATILTPTTSKPKEQLKISYNTPTSTSTSTAKPDILSTLMNTNLNLSTNSTNDLSVNNNWPNTNSSMTMSNIQNNNYSSLDDLDPFGSSSVGQSMPKITNTSNNNNNNSISPRMNPNPMANTFTLQKPTVDYIYPTGYNGNQLTSSLNNNINNTSPPLPLKPFNLSNSMIQQQQQMTTTKTTTDSNFNTLSQQDIMNFLN